MANKVSDTLKELKAISSKIESIRTESRRFLDNQEREMQAIQGRINVLCSSLVESDSMALGTNQFRLNVDPIRLSYYFNFSRVTE